MSQTHKQANNLLAHLNARVNGMVTIDAKLDLSGGVSVVEGKKTADDYSRLIAKVQQAEAALSATRAQLHQHTGAVRDLCDRILTGVATRYGKNSEEYKKVGGKPKSERKRGPRKSKAATMMPRTGHENGAADGHA